MCMEQCRGRHFGFDYVCPHNGDQIYISVRRTLQLLLVLYNASAASKTTFIFFLSLGNPLFIAVIKWPPFFDVLEPVAHLHFAHFQRTTALSTTNILERNYSLSAFTCCLLQVKYYISLRLILTHCTFHSKWKWECT